MRCDEDCRTAGFGKTERPVGWEGNGELVMTGLMRHCSRGNSQLTDRPHLTSLSHSFTLDLVMAFADFLSAKRVLAVLGKRLARYGLTLHPEKTRFIDFRFKRPNGMRHAATSGTTFDFLGFTHVWVRSKQGKDVVRQSTAKNRFARALASVSDWCRHNLHRAIDEQHLHLSRVMRGHFAYYGITGNGRRLRWYAHQVERIWQKWLSRRGQQSPFLWTRLRESLTRHPLPSAKIVHRYIVGSEAPP